jgi:uncharacterized membrane protein YqiK
MKKQINQTTKKRLSDKYRGILSKKQGENLNEHIKQMREEWDRE